jgi:hypothetical protein
MFTEPGDGEMRGPSGTSGIRRSGGVLALVGMVVVLVPTSRAPVADDEPVISGVLAVANSAADGEAGAETEPGRTPRRDDVTVLASPEPVRVVPVAPEGRFGESDRAVDQGLGIEPVRVRELVDARTASSDSWVNDDGSLSVRSFAVPRYYQAEGESAWVDIDTTMVADESAKGRMRSKANRWSTSFGASGSPEGMQRLDLGKSKIMFSPIDARDVQPLTAASTVTYAGLWPETDAVYVVSAVGVDERLVLRSAGAPSVFEFDITGARPRANGDGGIDLLDGGAVMAKIPPLTVDTAEHSVPPKQAGARFVVFGDEDGGPSGRIASDIGIRL